MSSEELLKPFERVGFGEIDAADPGRGAPGTDPDPAEAEVARAEAEFADRMAQERHGKPVFRAPAPPSRQ